MNSFIKMRFETTYFFHLFMKTYIVVLLESHTEESLISTLKVYFCGEIKI